MSTATKNAPSNGTSGNAPSGNSPWRMKATSGSGGGDFEACPAGNHPGTIIGLFDIGTQITDYGGERKEVRQLVVVVEVSSKKKKDGRPFVLGQRYTWSFNKKANFRAMVEGVTGHTFKEDEEFDPTSLLGLPVMVNVTNQTSGEGESARTYANIQNISQFPEGFPSLPPTRSPFAWSVADGVAFPDSDLTWLPYIYGSSIKDLADSSREARKRGGGGGAVQGEEGDGIPF